MKKGTHPICLFKYMKFLFIVVFLNKPTSNISKYPWLQLSFAKWQLSANFPQHAQRFHHFVHVFSPASPDFFPKKVPHFHPFFVPALSFSSPRTWLKRRPFRFSLPSCRAGKGQNDGFMVDKMVDKMGKWWLKWWLNMMKWWENLISNKNPRFSSVHQLFVVIDG